MVFIVVVCFVFSLWCCEPKGLSEGVIIIAKSPEYSHILKIHGCSCLQMNFHCTKTHFLRLSITSLICSKVLTRFSEIVSDESLTPKPSAPGSQSLMRSLVRTPSEYENWARLTPFLLYTTHYQQRVSKPRLWFGGGVGWLVGWFGSVRCLVWFVGRC